MVAPLAADHRFRTARNPQVFTAVLRTVLTYAAWLEVIDPITDVFLMAGRHNTLRHLVADGTPAAIGLHAIGDSVCTTNPTLGCSPPLALTGAADLADAIGEHAADPAAQALGPGPSRQRARCAVLSQSGRNRRRAAGHDAAHHLRRATVAASPDSRPGHLFPAARAASYDPIAFRAFWTINEMTCPPGEVYTAPDGVAHAGKSQSARDRAASRPAYPRAAAHALAR